MALLDELRDEGFALLPEAVDAVAVAGMRDVVTSNLDRMANTRPNPSARHIAGFHRDAALAPLHEMLAENPALTAALAAAYDPAKPVGIGLSDITVNRSQHWHTDLLRGEYASHLTPEMCWGETGTGCLKALLYLQDGTSLKVVPGSHRHPISLADDGAAVPSDAARIVPVAVRAGDIVLMDIRVVHRGSTDAEMAVADGSAPKILVSTVFGAEGADLTRAMQAGNAKRTADWRARHLS